MTCNVSLAVLCIAVGIMGCGSGSQSTRVAAITKLEAQEIKPFGGAWLNVFRLDDTSFIALTREALLRYNSNGDTLWIISSSIGQEKIDLGGVHIENGKFYLASSRLLKDNYAEYRLHAFDIRNGTSSGPTPLSKMNPGDQSGPSEELMMGSPRREWLAHSVSSVFSPDSSKLLAYKFYPVGNDRLGVEMMLYRRGYSLIKRSNVDFRFNGKEQSFLGAMTDNDGVAYLFIGSKDNRIFDVGRFEVLGGTRLRTIRYEFETPQTNLYLQTALAVASRGHAYLAMIRDNVSGSNLSLVDFDFYLDSAIKTVIDSSITMNGMLKDLFLAPTDDRLLIVTDQLDDDILNVRTYATDLAGAPVWSSMLKIGHNAFSIPYHIHRSISGELGYWYVNNDVLAFRRQTLRTGEWSTDPHYDRLARVDDDLFFDFAGCLLDRRTLISRTPAYKIVLPN